MIASGAKALQTSILTTLQCHCAYFVVKRVLFSGESARVCVHSLELNKKLRSFYSPKAESFGVSAQIGSGVVQGGPEVRFHEGSTRVPRGSARAAEWCKH